VSHIEYSTHLTIECCHICCEQRAWQELTPACHLEVWLNRQRQSQQHTCVALHNNCVVDKEHNAFVGVMLTATSLCPLLFLPCCVCVLLCRAHTAKRCANYEAACPVSYTQ
jgi:hypothetical protein